MKTGLQKREKLGKMGHYTGSLRFSATSGSNIMEHFFKT